MGERALATVSVRRAILLAGTAIALAGATGALPAHAQTQESIAGFTRTSPDAQLFLEADQLVYDNDNETVAAIGGVRIDYDGTRVVARKVVYDQRTRRLKAYDQVEIVQPDGTRITADEIDLTDDFRDGFVNSLRIITNDNTRFAAESAERSGGNVTTLNQAVYTACEPCAENPDKPPIWQIKSRKIIWNGEAKTIRYEDASFEFFGYPIAWLPVFTTADPTVKRKTGFLAPRFKYGSNLGYGVGLPFFWNLAPNYDVTFSPTYFTKQGLLGEVEFRHRLESGYYSVKFAGIHQRDPSEFRPLTNDRANTDRGMVGSKGRFDINPRWSFGWDVMAQSDPNFAETYGIEGYTGNRANTVYLTGMGERNHFDLRAFKFSIQETLLPEDPMSRDPKQPWVLPSFDYSYVAPNPVLGGELNIDLNARHIERDAFDGNAVRTAGLEGGSSRITGEVEWKRTLIAPAGLVVTPLLAARADGLAVSPDFVPAAISASNTAAGVGLAGDNAWRTMVTAGLEVRWPILFSTTSTTHVLEPMAQVFVRPDETLIGEMPNEDAQSFVFDASNLFERDKFSGYDRVEGGSRANFGLRYSGDYGNGWSGHALFGQSYHLGGINSFAGPDFVNAGLESGLETKVSDYVGAAGVSHESLTIAGRARFEEQSFEVRRAELEAGYSGDTVALAGKYAFIEAQPTYGFTDDRHQATVSGSLKFGEYWKVFGSLTHDIKSRELIKNSIGLSYDDECFSIAGTYVEDRLDTNVTRRVGLFLSFRTLGEIGSRTDVFAN